MKFKLKNSLVCLLAGCLIAGVLTGCAKDASTDDYSQTVVATYGDEKIYLDEARFFAKLTQYSYEASFGAGQEFWEYNLTGSGTMESSVKTDVMKKILQTRILCDQAEKDGVTLSEDDKKKVTEKVDQFMKDEEIVEITGATRELLERLYTENALANRQREKMIANVDTNVDEKEFQQKKVEYLYLTEDDDDATDESKVADEILQKLESGKSATDIEKEYEDASYKVQAATVTFGESDDKPYVEEGWKLSKDECATAAVDGDGWYIMRCLDDNDLEAKETAIQAEIKKRQDDEFNKQYEELKKTAPKFTVDEDVWALISFKDAAYVAPSQTAAESTEAESTGKESEEATIDSAETTVAGTTVSE